MDIFLQEHSTLSFLPQSPGSLLKGRKQKLDILKLIMVLNQLAIEALELFIQRKLEKFDAQVGENLCQIRAYKIMSLANTPFFIDRKIPPNLNKLYLMRDRILTCFESFKNLEKNKTQYNASLDSKESLLSFCEKKKLTLPLPKDLIFIIFSHFLCKFCVTKGKIPIAINYRKISDELEISKYISKRIVHHYQTMLADLGCQFILHIASEMDFYSDKKKILLDLLQMSDENRHTLPCHEVTNIIFRHMIKKNLPILIAVNQLQSSLDSYKEIVIPFYGNKEKCQFDLLSDFKSLPGNSPFIVIRGETNRPIASEAQQLELIRNIIEKGVLNILLGNTAMHPQYSGSRLTSKRDSPFKEILMINHQKKNNPHDSHLTIMENFESKLMNDKKFAILEGCCKENPSLFFLKHIYCASYKTLKNNFSQSDSTLLIDNEMTFRSSRQIELPTGS